MTDLDHAALAGELYDAEKQRTTLRPLTERHPDLALADAYAVQSAYATLRRDQDGTETVGVKVGATSLAIQEYFGIDQPDFGVLLGDMRCESEVALDELIQPRMEPELAFILSEPLAGPGVGVADVLRVTKYVLPCLEIIDSRIDDWQIRLEDTVADNGSSARFVLGDAVAVQDLPDLATTEVTFGRNAEPPISALGSAVLGHPAAAVAWLANALGALGARLESGHVVLSGSFTTAVDIGPGDVFTATFAQLGTVSVRASEGSRR